MQYTNNFSKSEFDCPCCGKNEMDINHVKRLQVLRDELNRPLSINSGYRCEIHNEEVGGVTGSRHLIGIASDIDTEDFGYSQLYELIKYAIVLGFRGIGIGENFVHLDTRKTPHKMWTC